MSWADSWRRPLPPGTAFEAALAADTRAAGGGPTGLIDTKTGGPIVSHRLPQNDSERALDRQLARELEGAPPIEVTMLVDTITVSDGCGGTRLAVVGERLTLPRAEALNLIARQKAARGADPRIARQERLAARKRALLETAKKLAAPPEPSPPPTPARLPDEPERRCRVKVLTAHIGPAGRVVEPGDEYEIGVEDAALRLARARPQIELAEPAAPAGRAKAS